MPLLLGQLVYTSFANLGFRTLFSAKVPTEIQQAFVQQVVHQYWDAYNPPSTEYRAAYLYQITLEHSLFGWLYNDGMDDLGRCHIPYFVCYYLAERLDTAQLENIFTCLQKGPVSLVHRHSIPATLESIVIPDVGNYQSAHRGVVIPSDVREHSHIALKQKQLLNLFVPVDEQAQVAELNQDSHKQHSTELLLNTPDLTDAAALQIDTAAIEVEEIKPRKGNQEKLQQYQQEQESSFSDYTNKKLEHSQPALGLSNVTRKGMNTGKIEETLQELVSKSIGIQGAVLVSPEGQPVTAPIGMDKNSALKMAGIMLYLAVTTQEEFNWHEIEDVSVRGQEGHIILTACNQDIFLLVKAGKALTGLLDVEISRTVKKLQTEFKAAESLELDTEVPLELGTEATFETESEIRYRGRPINF